MPNNRPRVCLISHVYLEKRYRSKLNFLARDVDLTLVSPNEFPFAYGQYSAEFSEEREYKVRVYSCFFPLGLRTSTRWILASRDLGFRQHPPDIIHVENEAHSFSLLQAMIYRRVFAPKARVLIFVWANQRLIGLKGVLLTMLARVMRPGIDFYIAGNSEGRELLLEAGIPAEKIAVFPVVGVDTDYFSPASEEERVTLRRNMGLGPEHFVVGFVGRFVEDKGIFDLLQAFQKLRTEMNHDRLRLLCVGDGPLKSVLMSQGENVLVVSPGGNGKVLPYYRMMDALVLPSRTLPHWKEQFGLVLVEAMACGLPLVGSNSGAIPEVMGDAGKSFAEGKVSELVAVLSKLMASAAMRKEQSKSGSLRAKSFGDKAVAERTASLYRLLTLSENGSEFSN